MLCRVWDADKRKETSVRKAADAAEEPFLNPSSPWFMGAQKVGCASCCLHHACMGSARLLAGTGNAVVSCKQRVDVARHVPHNAHAATDGTALQKPSAGSEQLASSAASDSCTGTRVCCPAAQSACNACKACTPPRSPTRPAGPTCASA